MLPLIPYLLQASPIISAERLQLIYRNLERGISSIVQIKKPKPRKENGDGDLNKCDDGYAERVRQHQEEVSSRAAEILHQLGRLALVGVDISVLSVTNMPDKLRALYKRKGLEQYPEITKTLRGIHSKWKVAIKDINRPSTIRGLKGGNVITASALGEGEDLQLSPPSVPTALWKVLARTHNETQLFAIKYVVSSMKIGEHESEHDTRICLIQGPPGNMLYCYKAVYIFNIVVRAISICIILSRKIMIIFLHIRNGKNAHNSRHGLYFDARGNSARGTTH